MTEAAWLIFFFLMAVSAKGGSEPAPAPPGPPRRRVGPMGQGRPIAHTFSGNATAWALSRWNIAKAMLAPLGSARPDLDIDEIATSVVTHWAIETDWGSDEYNFNLGGIHANPGEAYFQSTDAGKPAKFAAYDSIEGGAKAYGDLLQGRYRPCAIKLLADPESADWYVCLGSMGYYGKPSFDVASMFLGTRKRVAAAVAIK